MRLLDLFCGAGGVAKGYADAGFEVVGVAPVRDRERQGPVIGIYGDRAKTSRGATLTIRSSRWSRPDGLRVGREAMGIDWMTWKELREAIPPAYTQFIGEQLMTHLNASVPRSVVVGRATDA